MAGKDQLGLCRHVFATPVPRGSGPNSVELARYTSCETSPDAVAGGVGLEDRSSVTLRCILWT